jgi:hypothetical protein
MYDPDTCVSLPSVPTDHYQSLNVTSDDSTDLLVSEIASTLDGLGQVDISDRQLQIKTISLSLRECERLLQSNPRRFTGQIITQIIKALSKFPLSRLNYKVLYHNLLQRSLHVSRKGGFYNRNSAILLCALAKLSLDLRRYDD